MNEIAQAGFERYNVFEEPQAGYAEQVFYHSLQPNPEGQVEIRLVNPRFNGGQELSVTWRYALADYPILVEWKMMGEGAYVVGVEPSNCQVSGRCAERERGTLQMLEPMETRQYRIEVSLRCSP